MYTDRSMDDYIPTDCTCYFRGKGLEVKGENFYIVFLDLLENLY